MLLGAEYEFLSYIANMYKRHKDGFLRFSEEDLNNKFCDGNSSNYIKRLEDKEIILRKSELILVDTNKWAEFFSIELNRLIQQVCKNLYCKYNYLSNEIQFFQDSTLKVSFYLRFNSNESFEREEIIDMCFSNNFSSTLFWLDILNDKNLLMMLYAFLNNEISYFNGKHRIRFNFFEGVEEEYIREIFQVNIRKYFEQGKKHVQSLTLAKRQLIYKYIRQDNFDAYEVDISGDWLIIAKVGKSIEFFSFEKEALIYSSQVTEEIKKLEKKLNDKISEYRRLTMFNKNKVVESATKLANLAAVILSPVNLVLCTLTLIGIKFVGDLKHNFYVLCIIGAILFLIVCAVFKVVYLPAYMLSKFNWRISYNLSESNKKS